MMLTIFLRHDETKTVDEIDQHLKQTGWFRDFPPPGVEVVSWYVMMGIGEVVNLRFPAERLRDVNRLVEDEAWGEFHADFYPTYDHRALYEQLRSKMQQIARGSRLANIAGGRLRRTLASTGRFDRRTCNG